MKILRAPKIYTFANTNFWFKVGEITDSRYEFTRVLSMTAEDTQSSKVGKAHNSKRSSPNSRKYEEVRSREHLPQEEVEVLRDAIKKNGDRHAHRDSTLILIIYRHGLRVEEVAQLRWDQIDFAAGNLHVKRIKRGTPSTQPLGGDELRALRRLQREYSVSPFVFQSSRKGPLANDTIAGIIEKAGNLASLSFPIHPHMLRHGTGYYLANKGIDTRTIQAYLGHKNIQHTVRYTELAPGRFKGLWDS